MHLRIVSYCFFIYLSSFSVISQTNNKDDYFIKWSPVSEFHDPSTNITKQLIEGNITIALNQSVTVFVPKNSWLKVNTLKVDLNSAIKYQATISEGVAYQLFSKKVTANTELITPEPKNRVVTLFNDSSKKIELALFSGKSNKLSPSLYHREINPENLTMTKIIKQPLNQTLNFSHIKEEQKAEYLVEGPTLLKVTSFITNSSTHTKKIAWQINSTINGQALINWHHKASINRQHFYTIENLSVWATSQQIYYLKIPKGKHKLILEPSIKNWLKVDEIANDFLLPSNHSYLIDDEKWAIEQLLLQQSKEQFAIKVLSNPKWLDDPKSTLDTLTSKLSQHEAALAVKFYTNLFFKDLIPKANKYLEAIYLDSAAKFWLANHSIDVSNPEVRFISSTALQESKSKKASKAFYKLTKQQTMTFELPKERILSDIKIKLYNPEKLSGSLQISTNSQSIIAYLQPDYKSGWLVSNNLKEVVTQLRNNKGLKETQSNSDLVKKQHSEITFKVSEQDSTITIKAPKKGTIYLSIGYIEPQREINNEQQWLTLFMASNYQGEKLTENKATNIEVSRLHQMITEKSEQFTHGLHCEPLRSKTPTIHNNNNWLAEAEFYYSQGLTEELSNLLFNISQHDNNISLWQLRLKLLSDEGLWTIYSQVLRGLSCDMRNIELQHYAQKTYADYKLKSNDYLAYEQLLAFKLSTQKLSPKDFENTIYKFALVLFNQGKYSSSLASLTLLPLSDKTAQLSLWVTQKLGYWQLYQYILSFVDIKHTDFYLGLQAFEQVNYSEAMALWRLDESDISITKNKIAALVLPYFANVITPETPNLSRISKLSAKSIITAYTAATPSGFNLLRMSKKQAIKMTVQGPLTLRLTARQLKTPDQVIEDNWLLVSLNGTKRYIPINKSSYISNYKIKESNLRLGKKHDVEFSLPAGEHQLNIKPQHTDMLMSINSLTTNLPDVSSITKSNTCLESQYWQLIDSQGKFVDSCLLQQSDKLYTTPNSLSDNTPGKVDHINILSQKIYLWENAGKKNDSALVNIQASIVENKDDHLYNSLKSRMSPYVSWHLLQPTISAGIKILQGKPLTFQSPLAQLSAISKNYDENVDKGTLFKSFEILYFDLNIANKEQAKLRIRSYMSPYTLLPSTQVNMNINDKVYPPLTLKQNDKTDIKLDLKSGANHIALNLMQAYSQQFFTAEILVKSTGEVWRSINNIVKRKVDLTAVNNELSFYLSSPSLLRIDTFNKKNEISSFYHHQNKPGRFSIIKANQDSQKLGYRVYQMNKTDKKKVVGNYYQIPALIEKPKLSSLYILEQSQQNLKSDDLTHKFSPNSNIWGGHYQAHRRFNYDEGLSTQFERFNEFGLQQRNFNQEKQRYWRFDVLARFHDNKHKVLGLNNYLDWRLADSNQLVYTKTSAFYQLEEGKQKANWSAMFNLGWQRNDDFLDKLDNQLDISVFGQSVADLTINRQYWDNDVYSAYKNIHENGVKISNRLRFTPYQDAELGFLIGANSNPVHQKASIDSASILLSGKLYWRGLTLVSTYHKKYFFADDDRLTDYNRERWSLGLQHRFWQEGGQLWRFHSSFNYDVVTQKTSFNLGLSWNATREKGLTDFRLKEVAFRDLYQQQAKNSIALNEGGG